MQSVDFDPGPGISILQNSISSGFISKLDNNGDFLWASYFGNSTNSWLKAIGFDENEHVYAVGRESVARYDPLGSSVWSLAMDADLYSINDEITNEVFISGRFSDTLDADPGVSTYNLIANGNYDALILNLDTAGQFLWADHIGSSSYADGKCINRDDSGNILLAGRFQDTIDFDPGPGTFTLSSPGYASIYISKYDSSLNWLWTKSLYMAGRISSMKVDEAGNIYSTGYCHTSDNDFDPGSAVFPLAYSSDKEMYLSRLDENGSFVYAKRLGGISGTDYRDISMDIDDNLSIYLAGSHNFGDFDPGPASYNPGNAGAFILKLKPALHVDTTVSITACESMVSPSGDYTWTVAGIYTDVIFSSLGYDSVLTINLSINYNSYSTLDTSSCNGIMSPDGNEFWFFAGEYQDTIPNSTGCDSIISIQLSGNTESIISEDFCDEYISHSGNYVWTAAGSYSDTIVNSLGCDSVINYTLSEIQLDTSVVQNDTLLYANLTGAGYEWLDCDNLYAVIPGANSFYFMPGQSGSYALMVTQNGCSDTSSCYQFTLTGFEEKKLSFQIYPVPANEKVCIRHNGSVINAKIEIFDLLGICQHTRQADQVQDVVLDLTNLKSGSYIIRITDCRKGAYNRPIIIK